MLQHKFAKPLAKTVNTPARSRAGGQGRHQTSEEAAPFGAPSGAAWNFGNVAVASPGTGGHQPPLAAPAGVQRKLAVGAVDDPLEHEAERAADQVMRASEPQVSRTTPPVQISRKCSACEEEETGHLQRAPEPGAAATEGFASRMEPPSGGERLPEDTRLFMERRFGADLSEVRIHAGEESDAQARMLNAQAFTIGNHIHFRKGKFAPDAFAGRHLLAHELTHTLQQGGGGGLVQCKTAAEWGTEATALETQILAAPEYKKLNAEAKGRVNWIIAQAKSKPLGDAQGERLYYLKKLLTAITTPYAGVTSGSDYGCSPETEEDNRKIVDEALRIEKIWGGAYSDLDENKVATGTNKVKRTGEQGKTFEVDRTDLKNIRVHIKVKLIGKPDETAKIKALEDAIERSISMTTKGYYVDIEFVDKSGPDVFEFKAKLCEWPNSGNWASSPVTLSHEVHHAMGLDDRYDYIEAHAANRGMNVEKRLEWFVVQMNKTAGPRDSFSKMAINDNPLLAEDVCAVAFAPGADRNKCIDARKSLDPAGLPPLP